MPVQLCGSQSCSRAICPQMQSMRQRPVALNEWLLARQPPAAPQQLRRPGSAPMPSVHGRLAPTRPWVAAETCQTCAQQQPLSCTSCWCTRDRHRQLPELTSCCRAIWPSALSHCSSALQQPITAAATVVRQLQHSVPEPAACLQEVAHPWQRSCSVLRPICELRLSSWWKVRHVWDQFEADSHHHGRIVAVSPTSKCSRARISAFLTYVTAESLLFLSSRHAAPLK